MAGKILIAGASGFIGQRLANELCSSGERPRCLIRRSVPMPAGAEVFIGDLLQPETLPQALDGIDTAFYLVHSMAAGRAGFETRERTAAINFIAAASKAGIRRVIYLGGLGETGSNLSEHLQSRLEIGNLLKKAPFATTFLRAAIILGKGGASFEMIRTLVERLPIMITPRWVSTKCQPIAVDDVIRYLIGCLRDERTSGETFDIGGPDILTYREMMERFAAIEKKRLIIIPVPVLTPKLSSYWVWLITPVKPSISMPLIEGLANEVVCRENRIRELLPFNLTSYDEAVRLALQDGNAFIHPRSGHS